MDSCPKELQSYDRAHIKKNEEQDLLQHLWWGKYGVSAISVAVERCLAGKKAKQEYVKKPILKELFDDLNLTEEQRAEKEIQEAILVEEQWASFYKKKGLPETKI